MVHHGQVWVQQFEADVLAGALGVCTDSRSLVHVTHLHFVAALLLGHFQSH
jgi:hypothetical protein